MAIKIASTEDLEFENLYSDHDKLTDGVFKKFSNLRSSRHQKSQNKLRSSRIFGKNDKG